MKIGIFTQWYDPEPGPAGLMGILARELVARGHEVYVLTGFPNYPNGKVFPGYKQKIRTAELKDGVHILRVPLYPSHDGSSLKRVLNYLSFGVSAALLGAPKLQKLDVIWVNFSPITLSLPMRFYQRKHKVPVICEVSDLWPDTLGVAGLSGSSQILRAAEHFLHRWCNMVYANSNAVVYISPGIGQILERRGVPADRLRFIPKPGNEADTINFDSSIRSELGTPDKAIVLLYAGAIGEAQGLDALLVACSIVADSRLHVWIAGSGTHEQSLRKTAQELGLNNVRFLGRIDPKHMSNLYSSSDIAYISLTDHPLSRVTMPSKTQTILASGLPILCAAEGDVANLVSNRKVGFTAAPGDAASIAAAITHSINLGRESLAKVGVRARDTYDAEFSIKRLGDQAENLINSVTGNADNKDRTSQTKDAIKVEDLKTLAALHQAAFPEFFLSKLGKPFLEQFYKGFINDPTAIVALERDSSQRIIGVAVGTTEPEGFFSRLIRRQFAGFIRASLIASVRHPSSIPRLLAARKYRGDTPGNEKGAFLSSICVSPSAKSKGIGTALLSSWWESATDLSVSVAFLTTDAVGNDAVNAFYKRNGWKLQDQYSTSQGRLMNRYRRDASTENSDR